MDKLNQYNQHTNTDCILQSKTYLPASKVCKENLSRIMEVNKDKIISCAGIWTVTRRKILLFLHKISLKTLLIVCIVPFLTI